MQTHFVCSNCGFSSRLNGTCQNENCAKLGMHLTKCICDDGKHSVVVKSHVSNERGEENSSDMNEEKTEKTEEGQDETKSGHSSINTIDLDSGNF